MTKSSSYFLLYCLFIGYWKGNTWDKSNNSGIIISFLPLCFSLAAFLQSRGGQKEDRGESRGYRLRCHRHLHFSKNAGSCVACQLVSLTSFWITGRENDNKPHMGLLLFSLLLASKKQSSLVLWSLQTEHSAGFLEENHAFHDPISICFSHPYSPLHNKKVIW